MNWLKNKVRFKKSKNILYFFLLISSLLFSSSCNSLVSKNESYNLGYKDGYIDGLKAGKEEQIKEEKASKKKIEIDPAKNDIPLIPEFVEDTKAEKPDIVIPQKAIVVLEFIRQNKQAPEGYVCGRQFMNYERQLPQRDAAGNTIKYQEWDIYPKINGKNRGAQRIVTGSDGRAWYTPDHYSTFTEMK